MRVLGWIVVGLIAVGPTACRTVPDLPAINLNEPGWTLKQGQAVWQLERNKPEIAGELLFARRGHDALLQLTKNPLPFVTAQVRGERWHINFAPQRRKFSGEGGPHPRLMFVHLARALTGTKPPEPLVFDQKAQNGFTLRNLKTGETISGFLNP